MRNDDSIVIELRWRAVSVAADGRHRAGRRARTRGGDPARAAPHRQGSAPRQPHVEHAELRARAGARRRGRQRRPRQPLRPPRAGGAAALRDGRRGRLPDRPGRRGHGHDRRADSRGERLHRPARHLSCAAITERARSTRRHTHEGTKARRTCITCVSPRRCRKNSRRSSTDVIGCCIAVHRALGPGLLESIYSRALRIELQVARTHVRAREGYPVCYREQLLDQQRVDLIVDQVVVEIKAVERLAPCTTRSSELSALPDAVGCW